MMNGYLNCGASQLQQALIRQPAIQKSQFTPQPSPCFSPTNMETNTSWNDTVLAPKVSDVKTTSADEDRPSVLRSASDPSPGVSSKSSRDQEMDASNDMNDDLNVEDSISSAGDQVKVLKKETVYKWECFTWKSRART